MKNILIKNFETTIIADIISIQKEKFFLIIWSTIYIYIYIYISIIWSTIYIYIYIYIYFFFYHRINHIYIYIYIYIYSGRILDWRLSQLGFNPSFGNLVCLATLKSSNRMKQICLWMTIYIYIYIYIYIWYKIWCVYIYIYIWYKTQCDYIYIYIYIYIYNHIVFYI